MEFDQEQIEYGSNRTQINVNRLVAKKDGAYIFVHYLFESGDLHGATANDMVPVSEEEYERRLEEMRDYEWSPVAHVFDDVAGPNETWDEWIDEWIEVEGPELVLDPSYTGQHGDTVRERHKAEHGVEPEYVECIGGGRMSRTLDREMDIIYDQELWAACQEAEENGLDNLLPQGPP